jgi:hypothetical protein
MKTLFITSIYSNLYGTEFGGRASRVRHYRESLLNILRTSPTNCVCFTSKEEYDNLCEYFYDKNKINKKLLDIRIFNLSDSKHFSKIHKKKNMERMKTFDRCYEIQYNKFFWFDLIEDRFDYDRVYWIDAGLSHSGLFPQQYRLNDNVHGTFDITLFTPKFLEKIVNKTNDKLIVISKNNTHGFFWSQSLPEKYYTEYDRSRHIIGGMFGGTPKMYEMFKNIFENTLLSVLDNEDELFMEEQVMSCVFFNNLNIFVTEEFDDWFQRNPNDVGIKYFYNIFE